MFEHKGEFSAAELQSAFADWNWSADELLQLSDSAEVKALVSADVEYAMSQGVKITPVVFINGVLLEGKTGTAGRLHAAFTQLTD